MNELIEVPFHGRALQAVERDGRVWVSVLCVCQLLGVARQGQQTKLQAAVWACGKKILLHDASGREQETYCVDLDTLPIWLVNMNASRVKEEAKPFLAILQKEARQVLADHFLRGKKVEPAKALSTPEMLLAQCQVMVDHERRLVTVENELAIIRQTDERVQQVDDRVSRIETRAETALLELHAVDPPETPVPAKTMLAKVNELVRSYGIARNLEFQEVWGVIYKELYYRCRFDAAVRARHSGLKQLDEVERAGLMSELYTIAYEKLKLE